MTKLQGQRQRRRTTLQGASFNPINALREVACNVYRCLDQSNGQPSVAVLSRLLAGLAQTWDALTKVVISSQSQYIFRHQLKTWFFKKSFPDIAI